MKKANLKYVLPASVLATSALGFAISAHAMDFKVSGQVDRAVIAADNGEDSDLGFVDNDGSNSRFRFTGEQVMDNGMSVGFNYELGVDTNRSDKWDINTTSDNDPSRLDTRHIFAYVKGAFGKVSLGKGSAASDGTSEVDLSGTMFIGGGGAPEFYGGGINFLDDNGAALGTVGSAYNHFDGLSRTNNVRYDSPSIGGLVLSTSLSEGHAYDVAARYEGDFGGAKFQMAADWLDTESRDSLITEAGDRVDSARFQEYGGSASLLLASGLNFTGIYKHRKFKGDNLAPTDSDTADNYFAGIGYIIGAHHIQAGWGQTNDLLNDGSTATQYSLAYAFDWTKNVELYASYHLMQLDDALDTAGNKVDGQKINFLFVGTRIKFL